MSGEDDRGSGTRWRSDEGREYALERWRQERQRAEVDRAAREDGVTDETVVVGDGETLRPVPGPQGLGGLLGDVVRARGWEEQVRAARLHEAWPAIVGEQLAGRSRPGRLRGGVLQVVVEAPRWATQLQYMTDQLAGRVVAETGLPVNEVRVVVGDLDER